MSFYYAKYYTRYADELGIWKDILGFLSFVKIRHFIFFWFGTFIRKNFDKFIVLTSNTSFLAAVIAIYLVMTSFPVVYHTTGLEYIAYITTGFAITILVFTLFRKYERLLTKDKWLGKSLQFIGRRTLDIYLIHYFFLPYHCLQGFGARLIQYDNKGLEVVVILILSLCVLSISLIASSMIRLSPFLAHYLFGVNEKKKKNN